jgi:4'-phosphopantetheinyl transferase
MNSKRSTPERSDAEVTQRVVSDIVPNVIPVAEPHALIGADDTLSALPDTVHVWAFSLQGSSECIDWCYGQLPESERTCAERFVYSKDRKAYVFAHGLTRHLLGRYLGVPAHDLIFTTNPAGKPKLALAGGSISFNLTHASGRALLAVCDGRDVGVDLEQRRFDVEPLDIARYCFFGSERTAIEQAPEQDQRDTFLRYWVAKEAVLKGEGIGLGFPLDHFQVQFNPGSSSARIVSFDKQQLAGDWIVRMLPCDPGWFAAVAARGDDWTFKWERPPLRRGSTTDV